MEKYRIFCMIRKLLEQISLQPINYLKKNYDQKNSKLRFFFILFNEGNSNCQFLG